MKLIPIVLLLLSPITYAQFGQAISPNDSPLNPINSELNPNNSPLNPLNSPLNPNNSALSNNGIFDNSGKRIGYEVQAPSGVINYFDNSGKRIGYSPTKK